MNEMTSECSNNIFCHDEIVISGIAGRFPESDNVYQLKENLMNKIDLLSSDNRRWISDNPEIPKRVGKINNVEKFDASFFGVHAKQVNSMDPMCRMLLEHAYEAIIDAGVNPRQLRGTKTGVFIGACFSESAKKLFYEKITGFGITGCSGAMLANRISYWLGINGPSYTIDSACSSSITAIENACTAIRTGKCEAALVGAANLCLHPSISHQYYRLGSLSADGRCKCFDADADGYARSEAVGLIFIQKAKNAKRIYATLVHGKINCDGFKEEGITFPSSLLQSTLLKEFYNECGIPPTMLSYVEAHGTGTKVGDPVEVGAIETICCPGRTTPLRIGSVKSNLGHAESASGVCSIAKILIAMESGLIPPNLHYNNPRECIKSLQDGRIQVVTEVTPWEGGYVGINSFGFGGANAHILLKSNSKEKIENAVLQDDLPRLVITSGRTYEATDYILKDVESRPVDAEYARLYHDIHSEDIPGHLYRGYTIVGGSATPDKPIKEIQHYPGARRPIWFVFSGMGSQWAGMGTSLLKLPVFAESIKKCDAVLKPRGVDIYNILTNKDKSTIGNSLNILIGIAAVQIGLVDLLSYIGIVPDNIIGHSVGELGCAYADGCFTAEETILAAYARGLVSTGADIIPGSMAAVGLGYKDIKNLCPPDIDVACHNGPSNSTISGPTESVKSFIAKLTEQNIFTREVSSGNIPYHSRYIAKLGPKFLAKMKEFIPEPKLRSPKWVSTSVDCSKRDSIQARFSSAEYHTNNLLGPVLFEEALVLVPKDAVTIEIVPHGLLQAILRRSLPSTVTNISLTQRDHKNNVEFFLQGLGKLFNVGLHPQIAKLYPDIEFPVSRGTPMISPLVKWEHTADWYVVSYKTENDIELGDGRTIEISIADEKYEYLAGHVIYGRNLIPATGYLNLVWETIGIMRGEIYTNKSVVFEDVKFLRATVIPKEGSVTLKITIQKCTGSFEVVEGGAAVVTGFIRQISKASVEMMSLPISNDDVVEEMSSKDVYTDLRLRGYNYGGVFRSIENASIDATKGTITWKNNWAAFMDNMLQMQALHVDSRKVYVPTRIQKITIDTAHHYNLLNESTSENKQFTVRRYKDYDAIIAGGVEIRGLRFNAISRRQTVDKPILGNFQFVAHRDNAAISLEDFVILSAEITIENEIGTKMKIVEIMEENFTSELDLISPYLVKVLKDIPLIVADAKIVTTNNPFTHENAPENIEICDIKSLNIKTAAMIATGRDLLLNSNAKTLNQLLVSLKDAGFLMTFETGNRDDIYASASQNSLDIILEKRVKDQTALLLRKRSFPTKPLVIMVANDNFKWMPHLKSALKEASKASADSKKRIILVSEKDFISGLSGLVNCLRKEVGGEIIRGFLIQDKNAPDFTIENSLYADQLKLDLTLNVLRSTNTWGTYRHLRFPEIVEKPMHHVLANQLVPEDLSSFCWLEGRLKPWNNNKNHVNVVYASINFRDIMLATGKLAVNVIATDRYHEDCPFGLEFSGIDTSGCKVMGFVKARGFSNIVEMDPMLTWRVPETWSLEDAATVPCVYLTCFYALYYIGKMKKGDKILIHAGSGGVGIAAINLALREGCEVFTTVGTPEKRRFIRETFPQINDDHIGNSRDTSFEQMIIQHTKGHGVDIVLNSLSLDKLQASVRCLATYGRFLEIGKFDLAANNTLGMEAFLKEISFSGIMLDNLIVAPEKMKREMWELVQRGLDSGAVKPLPRTVFAKDEIVNAFRYMAGAKHIGKVLIAIRNEDEPLVTPIKALPRFHCLEDHSYVIVGGLGGVGLELIDWLINRGAKNIVVTSRMGVENGYQAKCLALWKSYGTKIVVVTGKKMFEREDCEDVLKTAVKLGPVDGIFNLAAILLDGLMENQTESNFEEVFSAKAWPTKQLDEASRKLCPKLQHFVVFSSIASGHGNAGQSNYGMSNSLIERICEYRVIEGLPGLAIQWGAIGDIGKVADMQKENKEIEVGGTSQQKISSCLTQLDKFLNQQLPIVSSFVVAKKQSESSNNSGALSLVETIVNIMEIKDLKTVSTHTSFSELGMDSLMAVVIKQTLESEFEIFLGAAEIRALTFSKLSDMSTKKSEEKKFTKTAIDPEPFSLIMMFAQLLIYRKLIREEFINLNKNETEYSNVFLIPGIDGCGNIFNNLVGKIKPIATCLELPNNLTNKSTIFEMAEYLLPHVLERNKNSQDFLIVGYSYGANVAIELARLLEAKGLAGRLVFIDGAPGALKFCLNEELPPADNENELQKNFLLSIMEKLSPAITPKLLVALENCTQWSEKLNAFINVMPASCSINTSSEDQRNLLTTVYRRTEAFLRYDFNNLPPLQSSIVLLKSNSLASKIVSPDYDLGKLTCKKVDVYNLDGNHVTILDDDKIATVINDVSL